MENFKKAIELANQLIDQEGQYQVKPTKAESKRMRDTLNELKKVATNAKKDLIEADKSKSK